MLSKKNRADKKAIEKIFKACPPNGRGGKFFSFPNMTFKYILEGNSAIPRISFIAPKSVAKLAVKRNFQRRLGYNILAKYINQFPTGLSGVFVFKKYQDDERIIENEIKNILSKIN